MTEHDIQLLKSHFTFWDKLSPHQKDILIGGTTAVSYERGDSIHSADLDCVGVLLIKKGSVRVYILSEDGREITLYRLYDGDICILSASCVLQSITFDAVSYTHLDVYKRQLSLHCSLNTMSFNTHSPSSFRQQRFTS